MKRTKEEWMSAFNLIRKGNLIKAVARQTNLDEHNLRVNYNKYLKYGDKIFDAKPPSVYSAEFKAEVVRSCMEEHLTLDEVAIKYDVLRDRVVAWNKIVREKGYPGLLGSDNRYFKPGNKMGRPRTKKPEEMTELERLRYENECLKTEIALLKKVRALVEERNARLREIGRGPSKN